MAYCGANMMMNKLFNNKRGFVLTIGMLVVGVIALIAFFAGASIFLWVASISIPRILAAGIIAVIIIMAAFGVMPPPHVLLILLVAAVVLAILPIFSDWVAAQTPLALMGR